ncbi:sarcosine oxidase subunit gamma [Phaeovulum sp.]|uniref:sarcosine oxidase subunit gamma n=1 Tax=Phaeovulum sp. TaxID=2934796 RepID=UPI00272F024A|nr:sarcosine oxidase subunit gamma family protein [Phaeovulum sp.]MDP1670162.1 sarcosine oxidase subunit gamma family protein [Phaeovulum sp.]MDZ4120342.1 sarcosine oxidase subunit gamma family protein [Phaeovulum sp.]
MSEPISALAGKNAEGFARVSEAGLQGMITLRGNLASAALAAAVKTATGCALPGNRGIHTKAGKAAAWMSPDELLLLVPYGEAETTTAALAAALAGEHALAANVSDARALFRISGAKADQVAMKLCPVDFARLPQGEIRRTRAAQVAAALWRSAPDEISLVCFRSVAGYVFDLLAISARTGSELAPA